MFVKTSKNNDSNRHTDDEKLVLEASTLVKLIDAEELVKIDEDSQYRSKLDKTLEQVFDLISNVTGSLSNLYFNHSVLQHSFLIQLKNRF